MKYFEKNSCQHRLAIAATTDKKQRAVLGKLMSKFRDKTHDCGHHHAKT